MAAHDTLAKDVNAFLWPRIALLRYGRPADLVRAIGDLEEALSPELVDVITAGIDALRLRETEGESA